MALSDLTQTEREVVWQCVRAAAQGPFFDDREFHALFGLNRSEVSKVAEAIPNCDDADETQTLAINNSMNNLLGYPHQKEGVWSEWISVSDKEVAHVFAKWRSPKPSYGNQIHDPT